MIGVAWQVGARFVCTKCWVRSTHPTCAQCGQPGLDVGGAGGFTVLDGKWRSYAAFVRGRAMVSPFAAHRLPVVAGLAVALGLAAAVAPIVGMAVRPQAAEPAMFAVAAGMGLICMPFVAMFFGAFLVLYGNACRLLGALVGLVPTPLGFGRTRVNLVAAIFDFIANVLLCPIAVGEPPKRRAVEGSAGEVGTLVEPLTVHLRRDSLSFAERFDAWVDGPLTVKIGEATRRVDFVSGELALDQRCGERRPDASAPPRWADAPGRAGVARVAVLPVGTRVLLAPGRLVFS